GKMRNRGFAEWSRPFPTGVRGFAQKMWNGGFAEKCGTVGLRNGQDHSLQGSVGLHKKCGLQKKAFRGALCV
ncbi:MAG: hypothetical protein RR162_08860, partial [Oscillospiraceae bacterium]